MTGRAADATQAPGPVAPDSPGPVAPGPEAAATDAPVSAGLPVKIRRMRWWDIQRLALVEPQLFPDDPWSAETFWSELAQGGSRHYLVAEAVARTGGAGAELAGGPAVELTGGAGAELADGPAVELTGGAGVELAGGAAVELTRGAAVELAGYAGLSSLGHTADVQTLAVVPAFQGRGVGRALLQALLAEADRRGCSQLLLEVQAENERAQRLYRGAGFEQIALRRGYYGPHRRDAVVMRRRQQVAG